ncbi:MAG: hypothetical protein D6677_05575 [Calditrichaeota bacterium]|nr:MAG: hypothetical protein D6677_05575 [Calditrichota bacterium]
MIIITGREDLTYAQQAIRLQVFDYITKPFHLKTVWQAVQNAYKHYQVLLEEKELLRKKEAYAHQLEKEVREKTETLKQTALFYRELANEIPFGIMFVAEEQVTFINKMALKICGQNQYEGPVYDLIHADKRKSFKRILTETRQQEQSYMLRFRIKVGNHTGQSVPVRGWFYPMRYHDQKGVIIVFSDQSPLMESRHKERRYKTEYFKEYNLSLIGQLASGIAHNLNTPLSIIQGNAELLSLKHPELEETRLILRQTEHMGKQIANLIKKGKNELTREREDVDLNQLIREEIEFARANLYFKHYITTRLELAPKIPLVNGVYYDFSVCISALIQNAVDSMYEQETRVLTIQTSFDATHIRLDIRDTGVGIPPENHKLIFEPFYSTKPDYTDKDRPLKMPWGNGLGLTMVMEVVEQYNLELTFESTPGKGTTFTLKFPRRMDEH